MELVTADQLKQYLKSKNIPFDNVTELRGPGGGANFVWRVESAGEPDTVVKHAEPYVKFAPGLKFTQGRMDFEAKVIRLLGPTATLKDEPLGVSSNAVASPRKTVTLPTVYHYDQERHVMQVNYAGPRTLKDAYQDPTLDVLACGSRIGAWLANLHTSTKSTDIGDHKAAKDMYRYTYVNLESTLNDWGFDGSIGGRINDRYGALLSTDDECVCHGDCWSGNFLVSEDQHILTAVDWEMTRRGYGATDVAQFAAEAYLLDTLRGDRGLMPSFFKAYNAACNISKEFADRVAVHFAAHICVWPTRVNWGTEKQTRELVRTGAEILSKVEAQDWGWLRNSTLREVFNAVK